MHRYVLEFNTLVKILIKTKIFEKISFLVSTKLFSFSR